MTAAESTAAAFAVAGVVVSVDAHPTGHINDGWLVTTDRKRYLLQHLNAAVFPDPGAVMGNIATVTEHLHHKGEPTLTLVATREPIDARWRMYEYIDGVPLAVASTDDAAKVGHAYGRFHRLLADLDPQCLRESLPGFHDPGRRVAQLMTAVKEDNHERLGEVRELVEEVLALCDGIGVADALSGLPGRIAHNDAKAANLLVSACEGNAPIVVDLDTVMAGSVLWDVGDMVRSSTGTADESTAAVRFDVERYRALVDAWLAETTDLLTPDELAAVPRAGPVVTFEQTVRFLTDYLRGDVYFRVSVPRQNLDRARNQLQLLRSMVAVL